MKKFVVKIDKEGKNSYKIISTQNEGLCRNTCNEDKILFIVEIDSSIHHWSVYELGLFYGWVDQEKCFLPLNHKEIVAEYLDNNYEKRNRWITKYAKIFNNSMDDYYTFKQYNKCVDLLNEKPYIKEKCFYK
jgi:hypothetical protein